MGQFYSCPDQATVAVIEKFGRFSRLAYPGFNCVSCCTGERVAGKMSLRIQQLDVACDTKTRDNVFVQLVVSVQYQVVKENLYDAFYKLTNSKTQITSYVFDVVRATVPKMNLDDVFITKQEIANEVKEELTKSMSSFGYEIIQTLVTDIIPDQKVRNAMNEINAAQRMRVAALEKAEASKIMVVKNAEADAESKFLAGQGIARQRQAIVHGLRESVLNFSEGVSDINSRDIVEMMMITQYFDMLKEVGVSGGNHAVFLHHSPGAVADTAAEIRNGFLQGAAGRTQTMTRG